MDSVDHIEIVDTSTFDDLKQADGDRVQKTGIAMNANEYFIVNHKLINIPQGANIKFKDGIMYWTNANFLSGIRDNPDVSAQEIPSEIPDANAPEIRNLKRSVPFTQREQLDTWLNDKFYPNRAKVELTKIRNDDFESKFGRFMTTEEFDTFLNEVSERQPIV